MATKSSLIGASLRLFCIFQTLLLTLIGSVNAEDFPALNGSVVLELNNRTTWVGPNRAQRDDLYLFAEANTALQLTESWLIRAIITLEPLIDPYPYKNRAFEDEDVRWKDVFIQYDNGVAGFRGGRITADFGFAWYGAPGLEATTLAEDYAVWDRMGASGWYRLQSDTFGSTTVSASMYSLDTSLFSASWLNTRRQKTASRGGPSNTDSPTSFAVALYGTDIPRLPGLSWQLALLRQQVDFITDSSGQRVYSVADEKGASANLQQRIAFDNGIDSTTVGEVVYLKDKGGVPGASGRYLIVGETLKYGRWRAQTALTTRWLDGASADSSRDRLFALTAGYDFTDRWSCDAVWRQAKVFGETADSVRVRLRYQLPF